MFTGTVAPGIQGLLGQQQSGYNQVFQNASGQGILNAAQPIFQRNLQLAADTLRQAGPRFASNTERLVREQGERSLQDFNLFAQQAMQSGREQQLAALAGLTQGQLGAFGTLGNFGGLLGQAAGGVDAAQLARLTSMGDFANTVRGQQLGFDQNTLSLLLTALMQAGVGPAVLTQNPGARGEILGALGTIGGAILPSLLPKKRP